MKKCRNIQDHQKESTRPGVRARQARARFVSQAALIPARDALRRARREAESYLEKCVDPRPVVAAAVDRRTGQCFCAKNTSKNTIVDVDTWYPTMRPRARWSMDNLRHVSRPCTHAEWLALNAALCARGTENLIGEDDLAEFALCVLWAHSTQMGGMKHGEPAPRCGNCEVLTDGVLFAGPDRLVFDERIREPTDAARQWKRGDRPWLIQACWQSKSPRRPGQ